jgi:hypothetical protein
MVQVFRKHGASGSRIHREVAVKLHDAAQRVVNAWEGSELATAMQNMANALKAQEMPRLLDNVSAISAEVHGDKGYHEFYMGVRENLAGFPGVWELCVQAAQEFTLEDAYEDDSFEWIGAIKGFSSAILNAPPDKLAGPEAPPHLRRLAKVAIEKAGGQLLAAGKLP